MSNKISNGEIADMLQAICFYKQLDGANHFSIRAFDNGYKFMQTYTGNPLDEDLSQYDGIGDKIAKAIKEAAHTGVMPELEKLKGKHPNIYDLTKVSGIGPKRALKFYEAHGIKTRVELQRLLEDKIIDDDKLLAAVKFSDKPDRAPRYMVEQRLVEIIDTIKPMCDKFEVVGSLRRKRDTVKDVDILVIPRDKDAVFAAFEKCGSIISGGSEHKCSITVDGGAIKFQVDLLCTTSDSWGAALNYFTGSKEHNIALRLLAKQSGLTVNEYGIFSGEDKIGGAHENDLYGILGLPFVPPELREGSDIKDIPGLISEADLTCDAHMHSTYSDGHHSIDEMVASAVAIGLTEIGISDHIANAIYGANMMKEGMVEAWSKEIDVVQKKYPQIKIFKGAEVDISAAGELTLPANVDELDYIVASAHTVPDTNLTERFISAMQHPKVKILGHPTGKEFGKRPEGKADWAKVFAICKEKKVAVEINGIPQRTDLPEQLVKQAIALGVKVAINSDAHNNKFIMPALLNALAVARRAGCTKDNLFKLSIDL